MHGIAGKPSYPLAFEWLLTSAATKEKCIALTKNILLLPKFAFFLLELACSVYNKVVSFKFLNFLGEFCSSPH